MSVKSIVIGCQGGGSHTAFTAGVLKKLLRELDRSRYSVIGLSGTSGGAMCAALAWYGLLIHDPEEGARRLDAFWADNAADNVWDRLTNDWLVTVNRLRGAVPIPDISPYWVPPIGQLRLRRILETHVPFDLLPALITPDSPDLLVGAVEVLTGRFTVFRDKHKDQDKRITAEALLATAALPTLFPAVRIDGGAYWDGLFSQNPPIREFLSGVENAAKPDEIWIIQINPDARDREPTLLREIEDRRNELSGNVSLRQELDFVQRVNDWLEAQWLPPHRFKRIHVRTIPLLEQALDAASKLDRGPGFIGWLMARGEAAASEFLGGLAAQRT
jgi:NTE family protein